VTTEIRQQVGEYDRRN